MNTPLKAPQLPPEFETILKDPRLDDLKDGPDWLPRQKRILQPANPPVAGESPFVLLREWNEETFGDVVWENEPQGMDVLFDTGSGQGLARFAGSPPRFRENKPKPPRRVDAWSNLSWLVVSPAFADIVKQFDPTVVETVPIDWEFADGQKLDGYQFLDVTRIVPAYDYLRSAVRVEIRKGKKYVAGLEHPRALKPGIDATIHVFREAWRKKDLFMSRELARALTQAGMQGIRFEDPVSIDTIEF